MEAQPFVNVTQVNVIRFIKTQIIYRFGVPKTINTDQGTMFTSEKMKAFAQQFGFLVNSFFPLLCSSKWASGGYQKCLNRYD